MIIKTSFQFLRLIIEYLQKKVIQYIILNNNWSFLSFLQIIIHNIVLSCISDQKEVQAIFFGLSKKVSSKKCIHFRKMQL